MNSDPKPSRWQRIMDNIWLLLALGVLIPFVSYTIWGWLELSMVSPAPLP